MRKLCIAIGVIFTVLVVINSQATAQEEIYGCVSNRGGKLRIVSDPSECNIKKETSIFWNQSGLQGPPGPPGECDCPITQEQLDEIYERIAYLESFAPPLVRFTDIGDGTIRDNGTGLIWLKDANCFGDMTWQEAMDTAASLYDGAENDCGLSDGSAAGAWRLPSKGEWEVFYSTDYTSPALVNTIGDGQWSEGDAFTGVQSYYYFSSTGYDPTTVWTVFLRYGYMWSTSKNGIFYVWPVRSGND